MQKYWKYRYEKRAKTLERLFQKYGELIRATTQLQLALTFCIAKATQWKTLLYGKIKVANDRIHEIRRFFQVNGPIYRRDWNEKLDPKKIETTSNTGKKRFAKE